MKKLLLHTCCAPCAVHIAEMLKASYDVTIFFHNPQIFPATEYAMRLAEAKRVAEIHSIPFAEGSREYDGWIAQVRGFENEPEGGKRCERCFRFNLEGTARYAKTFGFDAFATTLTVSPHKNAVIINKIGKDAGEKYGVEFVESDFKKNNGFLHSVQKSKEHGIYRQDYCGCEFSLKNRQASPSE